MNNIKLPKINYETFSSTRNSIQLITQLLSAIKGNLVPHQKNWEEFSLKINSKGFTTGVIPVIMNREYKVAEFNINLFDTTLSLVYSHYSEELNLEQNKIMSITKLLQQKFEGYGVAFPKLDEKFFSEEKISLNKTELNRLWELFSKVYLILLKLRGETLYETSNINFWPHHFDMSLLVFSGKLIEGQEPSNWDYSREQMNFGFSSGDENIQEPYFYVTSYPFNEKVLDNKLPEFAQWNTNGWKGMIIKLSSINYFNVDGDQLLQLFKLMLNENFNSQ